MKLKFNKQSIEWLALGIPTKNVSNLDLIIDGEQYVLNTMTEIDITQGMHTFDCTVNFNDGTSLILDKVEIDCNFSQNARMAIVFSTNKIRATNSMHSIKNWMKVFMSFGTIPFTALPSDYYYNKLGDKAFKLIVVKSK